MTASNRARVIPSAEESRTPNPEPRTPSLGVEIAGIQFKNPVLAAPGPMGFGREVQSVIDLRAFGGFVTKSVTVEPRAGNPYPQIVQTPAGWLNSLGLPNSGLGAFMTKDLPFLRTLDIPVVVSVAGESIDEFVTLVEWVSQEPGVAAVEINVACPNVRAGLTFGVAPSLINELISTLRPRSPRPLFVKLTPNVADIAAVARAAEDGGADALALINTILGLSIDVDRRRPKLGGTTGGLSGPAVRPVAVRMVWEVARACSIPVIGMGGISSAEDALEFFIAGAHAIAVGSAVIDNPNVATQLCNGLTGYLERNNMSSINEVVGTLEITV